MKILLFIDTLAIGGGAERQFAGLCELLHQHGYDIHVVAYHKGSGYEEDLKDLGINVDIKFWGKTRVSKLLGAWKFFRKINPDVVISYKPGPNFIACALKAMGGKWHLIVSDRYTVQKLNKNLRLMYWLYRYADYIIPNSFSQGNFIERYFPMLKTKIRVITNFTDTSLFIPQCNELAQSNHVPIVLVVARIAKQKNILIFLDAIAMLKDRIDFDFKVVWQGRVNIGEDEYFERCKTKITDNHLENVFEFRPVDKDVVKVYQTSDVFCLPSLFEGYPNVICEAMACGLPVVVSNVCDNSRIIRDGENGFLFNPNSKEDICNKIYNLLNMTSERKNLFGKKSRQLALENFSKENFISKYINLLDTFIDKEEV